MAKFDLKVWLKILGKYNLTAKLDFKISKP